MLGTDDVGIPDHDQNRRSDRAVPAGGSHEYASVRATSPAPLSATITTLGKSCTLFAIPRPAPLETRWGTRVKVLVVDDDPAIRRIAKLSLVRIGGMEVIEAETGDEALQRARGERPDAILLDVMMPGRDGPSTLFALRAEPLTASIPVVFLTATTAADEVERLRSFGAAGVLAKPFDPTKLPGDLRAAVARA
jgi:CheY-like chemotaxis protein